MAAEAQTKTEGNVISIHPDSKTAPAAPLVQVDQQQSPQVLPIAPPDQIQALTNFAKSGIKWAGIIGAVLLVGAGLGGYFWGRRGGLTSCKLKRTEKFFE